MSKRTFVPLPDHEQIVPFEMIQLQVSGKEIVIGTRYAEAMSAEDAAWRLSSGEWEAAEAAMTELLPFKAKICFQHPTLGTVSKPKLRRWLNKHLNGRWMFHYNHVLFESDFDGTHYKMFWV